MSTLVLARTQTLTAATAMTQIGTAVPVDAEVQVTVSGSGASLAAAVLALVGLDENGDAQNENVAITAAGEFVSAQSWTSITSMTPSGAVFTGYSAQVVFEDDLPNADGEDDTTDYETLSALRTRLLIRLGYASQVASPPPGMVATCTEYLQSAQRFLFRKFTERRLRRFFTWQMAPSQRFFTIASNQDLSSARLDPLKVEWVGISDNNQSWMPLAGTIPPTLYTTVDQDGTPARYEIRQSIEIFPPPDRSYRLMVKGGFKLGAFTADADKTSIESELVFLWALANAKNHYGHGDAADVATQANAYLGNIVAGSHATNRYVPGMTQSAPLARPRFLPLED